MRHLGLAVFLVTCAHASALLAAAPMYLLEEAKSTLKFYAIQNNAPVEGEFKRFHANIAFDPQNLDESSISVEVDTGSVDASYGEVASNLKLPEWLSVEAFPKATFVSKTISRIPQTNDYYADGELTIRGRSMPATLNFQLNESAMPVVVATGYTTVRRRDFGVGQGQWDNDTAIKDEVRVEFRVVARKQ